MKAVPKSSVSGRAPLMVFAGSFWRGSTEYGLAQGFRKLGWAVHQVDLAGHFPAFGTSIPARAISRLLAAHSRRAYQSAVRDAVHILKPDLFLTVKGSFLTAQVLKSLQEQGVPTVVFYPDFSFEQSDINLDDFAFYDSIITTKSFQVQMLSERFGHGRVAYVPHGYCDSVHLPLLGRYPETCTFDLQHIGSHTPHKQKWIESLRAYIPEASLGLIGQRWKKPGNSTALNGATICDPLYDCAYSIALQGARINVAVMMGPNSASGWEDLVSTRTFEIPACRSFMLHIDSEEVREFFKVGEEIDVFSSPEELADKARFYLARPDLRQRMIDRAYERCVPAYGNEARAAQINGHLSHLVEFRNGTKM
jgi:spore maturation protein CgeB